MAENKFEFVSRKEYETEIIACCDGIDFATYEELIKPVRATKGSMGYDIFSPITYDLAPGETIKIPTGVKVSLKEGRGLFILPRSSYGFKYRMQLDNTVGVIDEDYYNNENNEGHIFVKITNDGHKYLSLKKGEAFCQGIILCYDLAEDDDVITLRTGGMGSTSKN